METTPSVVVHGDPIAVASFAAYLLIIILIGLLSIRFSSTGIGEFFLAGRRLHRFVVALSAVVSGRSAWLLLGMTGMAYARGVSAVWAVVGYILVELFLFLFLAKRLRRFTAQMDNLTLPDFFESRYGDRSGMLRLVTVAIILVFMIGYVAAQFKAGGKAFAASFGLTPVAGVATTAGIVLVYTMLGGFLAVSLTDVVQAVFMILALVVLPIVAVMDFGGLDAVFSALAALDPRLLDPFALGFGAFIGFLGIGLGSPGNPHILVRYMAIEDARQLRTSALVGTVWNVVMAWGALYIGLVGRAFFPEQTMLPASDTENLYPFLAQAHLHPVLFGMVVASIFAAIMSTADSQLLVAASGVVRDLYQKVFRQHEVIPQRRLVLLSRIVVFALVVAALILGAVAERLVFWLVLFAWAGLGASFGPTVILSLYWKRTTRAGVVAGLLTGTLVTVIWYLVPALKAAIYELVPAFLLALLATVVVSWITTPPSQAEELLDQIRPQYR
jgi:sodium/proline symporter